MTSASCFAAGLPDLQATTGTPRTTAALAALTWIGANLHRVQPNVAGGGYRWEWHVALARQLLRSTYHADLPPPKRALAFAAAFDQLSAAAAAIAAGAG